MLKVINNWGTALAAPLLQGALEMTVDAAVASRLDFGAGDHYLLTLLRTTPGDEAAEIVKVTAGASGVLTIAERGVEGTTDQDWDVGATVICSYTAGTIQALLALLDGGGTSGGYGQEILDISADGTYDMTAAIGQADVRINQFENPVTLTIPNGPRQVDIFMRGGGDGAPAFTISAPGYAMEVRGTSGTWFETSSSDLIITNLSARIWGRLYVNPISGVCQLLVLNEEPFPVS